MRTDVMKEQLATFRSQLEEFARKHKVIHSPIVLYLVECPKEKENLMTVNCYMLKIASYPLASWMMI